MMRRLFLFAALCGTLGCAEQAPRVEIVTALGTITAEIYPEKAPVSAGNFLKLVDEGVYAQGANFYRVTRDDNQPGNAVKIDVIQGGLRGGGPPVAAIPHETTARTGLRHRDGTLSMARAEPGSATSEFFICIGDQPELDFDGRRNPDGQGFAAFGRVTEGMEVVREIQSRRDSAQSLIEPVSITAIRRIR